MKSRIFSSQVITVLVLSMVAAVAFTVRVNALSATALQQGIPSLAPMLEEVTPAVVSIRVSKTFMPKQQFYFEGQEFPEELKRYFNFQFPGEPGVPGFVPRQQTMGSGSGVIIDAQAGFIATNHHVINGADEITVTLNDRRTFIASLVGSDASTDVALLQIEADNLTALELADSDTAQIGDFVVAIGNPFGIGQTVTAGIVSALGRAGLNSSNYEDFIQTDAAINVGNSGGALVDMEGRLVGINTAIISSNGGGSNGIGFAVPANMVASVIDHLKRDGEVRRGMLGVQISNLTPDIASSLDLNISTGALVTNVLPDSAAEMAGIEVYDVIVEIDGHNIESGRDLRNYVGLVRQNEEVNLSLIRDGREIAIAATLGVAQGTASASSDRRPANRRELAGARLRTVEPGSQVSPSGGVVITNLDQQSRAWQAGLRQGDVITEVNREKVANLAEFNRAVVEADGIIAFTVLRNERRMMILLPGE